jgi:hypothetical protein
MTVLSVDAMLTHLNMTSGANDAELGDFIEAAEAIIATRVGPLESTTVTCTVSSAGPSLVLPITPVLSVTSVTSVYDGTVVDLSSLSLNTSAGIVTPSAYGSGFWATGGAYTVVYEAGRAEAPADLVLAIKEMVRHLWTTQRGGAKRPGSTDSAPAVGYLIPNTVAELLEPYRQFSVA